ncbi:hypothetical protein R4227_08080 [Gordonia amicalis]|uniref:hypothetical protein n=1 Tax=Gordonia amicalis TaxID=89053 RepID=UPI002955ACEB|nr:hypothetical protein [Gordonia amicalis]MDV7100091.1 hypothetical protein [Gordonia amicalis]
MTVKASFVALSTVWTSSRQRGSWLGFIPLRTGSAGGAPADSGAFAAVSVVVGRTTAMVTRHVMMLLITTTSTATTHHHTRRVPFGSGFWS